MESAFTGRSVCPACGYPVKYRWMGHGNEDLMVNPDGTPHQDSCPAAAFREIRKRAMKSPRARTYHGPEVAELIPPGTPAQIIERLLQKVPKRGRASAKSTESENTPVISEAESIDRPEAAAETPPAPLDVIATSANDEVAKSPAAETSSESNEIAAEVADAPASASEAHESVSKNAASDGPRQARLTRRAKTRDTRSSPDQPKPRRGRPRRDPVAAAPAEKPKPPQREVVRCPACAIPLITDLNTGAQVCLTCDFRLDAPQAALGG